MHKIGDLWSFNTRDLMRASTCQHCTTLSVGHVLKIQSVEEKLESYIESQRLQREAGEDKSLPMIFGDQFEEDLTDELIESLPNGTVAKLTSKGDIQGTLDHMSRGAPIIVQGSLHHPDDITLFSGMPDFLVRADWRLKFVDGKLTAEQTNSGDSTKYTAWDAKYSTHPKPEYALQVAAYIDALDHAGFKAENAKHGLILGSRTFEIFSEGEVVPAMRLARAELARTVASLGADSASMERVFENFTWHCDSNKECSICEYPELCEQDRKDTSDLLLVAGLGKVLRAKLITAGINTLDELARASEKPKNITQKTFDRVQAQARIQQLGKETGVKRHQLLPDPMIQFLPKPSKLDVFFDMEGFPYYPGGGLEYLFGNWTEDEGFTPFWAHTREGEKQAFEDFMDWLMARMDADPTAHVFHYAPYERTALKKLSFRHGIKSKEVARLETEGRLVDLYPFVTKSLLISEPRYSIKNLEKFYDFVRTAGVQKADDSIDGYFEWRNLVTAIADERVEESEKPDLRLRAREAFSALELYNKEDVQSTQQLYKWLLSLEGAATRFGENIIKRDESDETPSNAELELRKLEELTQKFFAPLERLERGSSPELDLKITAWETLAHSILFYRREDVMFWTGLQVRLQQEDEAFEKDKEAVLIHNVEEYAREQRENDKGKHYQRISYTANFDPDAIYEPEADDDLIIRFMLPGQVAARNFGKVISAAPGTVNFHRDVYNDDELQFEPDAILKYQRFLAGAKQDELNHLAEQITDRWVSPENRPPEGFPSLDLLLRRAPRLNATGLGEPNRMDYLPELIRAAEAMNKTTLAVQGPPGSGKTYLASRLIAHLTQRGKRVAVTANSHSAIENVLEACVEAGVDPASMFKTRQKDDKREKPWKSFASNQTTGSNMAKSQGAFVVGGTSFSLCNKYVRPTRVDYLIIDEAAQFSLVDALAVSGIADNIILFGDPQQLPQVVQAVHPGGVENSALGHFMGENDILPEELGFFVEITRRLHPNVNKAVSWLAYENKLESHPDTEENLVPGVEPGLHSIPVQHSNNSTFSPEEVNQVLELVKRHSATLPAEEILIVAPYNAQVNAIRKALDEAGFEEIQVGTVDKFQGREGMVVIYSFTASSADDAPRGLGFLLDRNRMNVAISRAKSVCYLVHSPDLLKATFSSIEDVKSVSRLAGLVEKEN